MDTCRAKAYSFATVQNASSSFCLHLIRQTVPVEFGSCGLGPERELIQNSYPDKTRDAYGIKLNEFHVNSTEFQFNS